MAERIPGLKKFLQKIRAMRRRHQRQVRIALEKCGALLLHESMKLVPVLTGTLRRTGNVKREGLGYNTVITVGYGTDYGIYVHEDLTKLHGQRFNIVYSREIRNKVDPKYYFNRRPEEQAKFLEEPFLLNRKKFHIIVTNELKSLQAKPRKK